MGVNHCKFACLSTIFQGTEQHCIASETIPHGISRWKKVFWKDARIRHHFALEQLSSKGTKISVSHNKGENNPWKECVEHQWWRQLYQESCGSSGHHSFTIPGWAVFIENLLLWWRFQFSHDDSHRTGEMRSMSLGIPGYLSLSNQKKKQQFWQCLKLHAGMWRS